MIRMTKISDYALVLLTYIARRQAEIGDSKVYSSIELANEAKLPPPTVGKILKLLAKEGILLSIRGAKGGYSLTRSPIETSVAQVLKALEGPFAITECLDHDHRQCEYEAICPTRPHWRVINDAIYLALSRISLAEMAQPIGRPLREMPVTIPMMGTLAGGPNRG